MRKLKPYIAALLLLSAVSAEAQENNQAAFSLQQAIDYAMKNSPSYLNAALDEKNYEYRRKEIAGLGYPQINGSIDLKDYLEIPTSLIPGDFFGRPGTYQAVQFGTKYNATAGVSASQLIFNSDYIFALKASREFIGLSKINTARSKADLIAQVSKAYYGVLINRDRLKLLDANVARLKKVYEDTKAFQQQGFAEQIDAERLEVQYNNLLTEKEKVVRLMDLSHTLLKFQMGYKLSEAISVTDSLNVVADQFQQLNASGDISRRPEYQLLKAQQTMLDLDLKRQQYGYLPSLVAYGSYQFNAQRNEFSFFNFGDDDPLKKWFKIVVVGATLNVSIFDGLQRHNRIQQARIASMKNKNLLQNLQLAGEMESAVAATSYNNAYLSLNMQKKNMDLAQHVYDVAQKKFMAGVGNNLEIVTAEASLTEAQTNYFNAVYDMLVAKLDYEKATGALIK
jgi:outer membrane protein